MNEPMQGMPVPSMPHATHDKSAGTLLREAREAAGIHVSALAASLKVPVKKLEALEADDLDQLLDSVFARALAATVCRTLNVDPEPVLARLPQMHTPHLRVGSQAPPVRLDNRGSRASGFRGLPRSALYLTALLLVGAVVVSMLPSWRIGGDVPVSEGASGVTTETVAVPSMASADAQANPAARADSNAAPAPAAILPALLASSSALAPAPVSAAAAAAGTAAADSAA
ncbi:MAG: helix-turn-helix domain-containing protein, partial [Burkholderiaceae bacterium]